MSALGLPQACIDCGEVTTHGARCRRHAAAADKLRRNPVRDTARYRRATRQAVERHVARFGWVCLGDERHSAHATLNLTADHVVPLAIGGAPDGELMVRCRSSNSARGAR